MEKAKIELKKAIRTSFANDTDSLTNEFCLFVDRVNPRDVEKFWKERQGIITLDRREQRFVMEEKNVVVSERPPLERPPSESPDLSLGNLFATPARKKPLSSPAREVGFSVFSLSCRAKEKGETVGTVYGDGLVSKEPGNGIRILIRKKQTLFFDPQTYRIDYLKPEEAKKTDEHFPNKFFFIDLSPNEYSMKACQEFYRAISEKI